MIHEVLLAGGLGQSKRYWTQIRMQEIQIDIGENPGTASPGS